MHGLQPTFFDRCAEMRSGTGSVKKFAQAVFAKKGDVKAQNLRFPEDFVLFRSFLNVE